MVRRACPPRARPSSGARALALSGAVAAWGACSSANFESSDGTAKGGGSGTAAGSAGRGALTGGSGAQGKGGASGAGGSSAFGGRGGTGGGAGTAGNGTSGSGLSGDAGAGTAGASDGCESTHCEVGAYCRAGDCYQCAELSQLDFGTPEPVLDHPSQDLRFPRPGDVGGSLFFTLAASPVSELWYEASVDEPPGVPLDTAQVPSRSGLLYFDDSAGLGFNVLFDELGANGRRSLRSASFAGGVLSNVTDAPPPLSPGDFDDTSVAFAVGSKRAYFMSTRTGSPALTTGVIGGDSLDPVDLRLAVSGAPGVSCELGAEHAAPWVSPDGSLLVVAARPRDAQCQPVDGAATDLYVAPLSKGSGLPLAPAIALAGVNVSVGASSETDGSFSSDLCTLYFASNGGDSLDDHLRLYRAERR